MQQSMYFTEEHKLFRDSLQDFLKKEVVPHIEKWEETGVIERFIWEKFGEMGFFGLSVPEVDGGLDLDLFYTVIFLEELQKINSGGFAAAMWAHAYLAMTHLNKRAKGEVRKEYLEPSNFIKGLKFHSSFIRFNLSQNISLLYFITHFLQPFGNSTFFHGIT